jgi:hypothetical protein
MGMGITLEPNFSNGLSLVSVVFHCEMSILFMLLRDAKVVLGYHEIAQKIPLQDYFHVIIWLDFRLIWLPLEGAERTPGR